MPAPKCILELVEQFQTNFKYYQSSEYNEEQLRHEFLNPFFEELGWDMVNVAKKGADRDVHYEKRIKAGAPDFGFYLDGKAKFFVEAKNPSVNVCDNSVAALQLRRYGWSANVPRGVLTDFEEFSIYDTTVRPKSTDGPRIARLECIKYTEYIERWDEIVALFSRQAVVGGSLEKLEKKRAKQAVDDELLDDISRWREALAKNIALRNPKLTEEQVNRAVQDTLDRIIFLRICEDRGIEHEGRLKEAVEGTGAYESLFRLFKKAEKRYDSGLFDLKAQDGLAVDNRTLKEIVSELYFPKSPYNFAAIPAEILGQVYEQFLGKVIRLTEGHHAKVEDKPEVRKAGGVYYTPSYIVEYIVKNTVGKLVEGKGPKDVGTLSVLDPACGSGSFLIGAYQYLMDWYRDWYSSHDAEKHKKAKLIYQDKEGQWQLTLAERTRILLAHIYGVDIDRQAVEVAKLSLMLKALEAPEQQSLFDDRILPDLSTNIKCGNSLIASDFSMISEDLVRVHAFDWPVQFAHIMKAGGFDAVIGNPPYRSLLLGKKQKSENDDVIMYYQAKFPNAAVYKMNLFGLFMERSISLLRKDGEFSFIIPNLFFTTHYFRDLRKFMLDAGNFSSVFDLKFKVFKDAETGGNGIFVFCKSSQSNLMEIFTAESQEHFKLPTQHQMPVETLRADPDSNLLATKGVATVMARVHSLPCITMDDACIIYQGIITGDNNTYLSETQKGSKWEKILRGRDINRYGKEFGGIFVFYEPKKLWSNTNSKMFKVPEKLISRQTSDRLIATYDNEGYFTLDSTHVIHLKQPIFSLKYLLGIYNSRLFNFIYSEKVREGGRAFAQVKVVNLKPLPIRFLDLANPTEKAQHDKLVELAEKMLGLMSKLHAATAESEKATLQNAVMSADRQIDQLVYKLYGLTEEEIRIVEEGTEASIKEKPKRE